MKNKILLSALIIIIILGIYINLFFINYSINKLEGINKDTNALVACVIFNRCEDIFKK